MNILMHSWMSLLPFCLACWGMTQIIVYGTIFDSIRPKSGKAGELFRCSMCVGFWVGLFLWLLNPLTNLFSFDMSLITGLCLGCISSASSYVGCSLVGDHGFRIEKNFDN